MRPNELFERDGKVSGCCPRQVEFWRLDRAAGAHLAHVFMYERAARAELPLAAFVTNKEQTPLQRVTP